MAKFKTIKISKPIYCPAFINGRWYIFNYTTGKLDMNLTFSDKLLSEMLCANFMGLRIDEAKLIWRCMDRDIA